MANYILISSKAEGGKSTVAKILKGELECAGEKVFNLAYGDHVKEIARVFYDWDGEKCEVGRSILQLIGDKNGRIKRHDELYFVKHLLNLVNCIVDDEDFVIIDDARYPFEIDYIRDNLKDGDTLQTIRINRIGHVSKLTEEQLRHESEISLDDYDKFDYHINNVKLEDLRSKCKVVYADIVNKIKRDERWRGNDGS